MKFRVAYLFWILMLAFGLIILVVATQMLTTRNISGLQKGNKEAAITFSINNRLQELVNLSFELEAKLLRYDSDNLNRQSIEDSLTMLGYNASILQDINLNIEAVNRFKKLNAFIDRQIGISLKVIGEKKRDAGLTLDSLRNSHMPDSIYSTALSIQKYLEKDLGDTLANNTQTSGRLSSYNKTLAIIAIAAVLILGTIIINRHLRQVQLIKDLEKATAAAHQSSMIKDQFLANMSHEIRTPLNAINGFSRLLSQTPLSGEQQQYSTIINDASGNLMHIVNDILDISKIEAGKLRIEQKEFNLLKVMQMVESMFFSTAAEKKLKYLQQVETKVPVLLKGDPERLSQVLINLISNAIKFTRQGYVSTTVSLQKETNENVWISFCVKDSGIGIPKDKQERVFQRFEQLNLGNDEITQGTGLGLSIVRNLISQMGGQITLVSDYNKGAEFTVLLPFQKVSVPGNEQSEISYNEKPSHHYTGAKVLVVEDNKVNQLLLEHTLTTFGIMVDIAANGQEAIQAIKGNPYDLIFLDIQMPVMDGYTTMHTIQAAGLSMPPVIAMTAYTMPGEREKCLEAGMQDYLAKPVDFRLLVNVLEIYLRQRQYASREIADMEFSNDFLMQLTDGDRNMTAKILQMVRNEIPGAVLRLQNAVHKKDTKALNTACHYMISTFSPLGNDTSIMRKLQELKNVQHNSSDESIAMLVEKLIGELTLLEGRLMQFEEETSCFNSITNKV